MVSSLNIPMNTISFFFVALIGVSVVVSDDCSALCGYTPPVIAEYINQSCHATGDAVTTTRVVINWNDGTSSTYITDIVVHLSKGSSCSDFLGSYYGTGVVTSGRFSGENLTFVFVSRIPEENGSDVKQSCNACQSNRGITRVISDTLLAIGTKLVGNWIECTGTATMVITPALTSTLQTVYSKITVDYDQCSNCVEPC